MPWRCLWLGAITLTRQPVIRWLWVSSRLISLNIWVRAASDDSEPSKVISGAICILTFPAGWPVSYGNPCHAEWLHPMAAAAQDRSNAFRRDRAEKAR